MNKGFFVIFLGVVVGAMALIFFNQASTPGTGTVPAGQQQIADAGTASTPPAMPPSSGQSASGSVQSASGSGQGASGSGQGSATVNPAGSGAVQSLPGQAGQPGQATVAVKPGQAQPEGSKPQQGTPEPAKPAQTGATSPKPETAAKPEAPKPGTAAKPEAPKPGTAAKPEAPKPGTAAKPEVPAQAGATAQAGSSQSTPAVPGSSAPPIIPPKQDPKRPLALRNIGVHFKGNAVTLRIEADGPFSYKTFVLPTPDRYVVDLVGNWSGMRAPTVPANSLVKSARAGKQGNGPRLVLDLQRAPRKHNVVWISNTILEIQIE